MALPEHPPGPAVSGVEAGWALVGKRPGSYEEYAVLAASREPFTHGSLRQIVIDREPASQPAVQEAGPGAMPRAWFTSIAVEGGRYVCLTISEWSDALDAINRPIVVSRFYCVRTDDLIAARLSYSDFYRAALDTPLTEELPDGPVWLNLRPARPELRLPDGHGIAAAAGLLEQRVGLLGGPVALGERIALLDDVMAFLPAGARAWNSAGGWTDTATRHPLRLACTAQVPENALAVNLRGPAPVVGNAYAEQLRELVGRHGADEVRAHLAKLGDARTRDVAEALSALQDMDREHVLLTAAYNGTLKAPMVRDLGAARFRGMQEDQRQTVLASYLEVASAQDLALDRELLVENWQRSLDRGLEGLIRDQISRNTWSVDDLLSSAETTAALGARHSFAGAVRTCAGEGASSSLREVVMRLAQRDDWSEALAPVVAQSGRLSVAVMRVALPSGAGVSRSLLERLDEHPDSSWERLGRPFLSAEHASEQQFNELHSVDPDAVADVVYDAHKNAEPQWRAQIVEWFFNLVRRSTTLPGSWIDLVRHGLEPMETALRARADFELCRRGLATSDYFGRAGVAYWDGLVGAARDAVVDERQRRQLGDALASSLGPDWGAESGRFFETMSGLWRLSTEAGGREVLTVALLRTIAAQVRTVPDRLNDERLAEWLPFFKVDPELHGLVLLAQLHGVREKSPAASVAAVVATVLHQKVLGENAVLEVLTSRWRPHPYGWVEFLSVLNARLAGKGNFSGPQICAKFVHALMRGDFGEKQQEDAIDYLPGYMMQQGYLTVEVFREAYQAAALPGRSSRPAKRVDDLTAFLEELMKRIRSLQPKSALGRILGRGEGSRER
ncbi:hypothetical protein JNUCC0626_46760 [Lentzea sp. JNUCC 0626]|uniref:hypothetical protein n=1 Tax=Lentzea sp. JNUCC 0626 TaxID=3367513 RepID=UPI00374A381B